MEPDLIRYAAIAHDAIFEPFFEQSRLIMIDGKNGSALSVLNKYNVTLSREFTIAIKQKTVVVFVAFRRLIALS